MKKRKKKMKIKDSKTFMELDAAINENLTGTGEQALLDALILTEKYTDLSRFQKNLLNVLIRRTYKKE
jgi:hypothetical protein